MHCTQAYTYTHHTHHIRYKNRRALHAVTYHPYTENARLPGGDVHRYTHVISIFIAVIARRWFIFNRQPLGYNYIQIMRIFSEQEIAWHEIIKATVIGLHVHPRALYFTRISYTKDIVYWYPFTTKTCVRLKTQVLTRIFTSIHTHACVHAHSLRAQPHTFTQSRIHSHARSIHTYIHKIT